MLEEMIAELKGNFHLTDKLAGGAKAIHHLRTEDARHYPQIVYSVISDVPAMSGDDQEIMRRVTVRFHILTRRGEYWAIASTLDLLLRSLGWRRRQSVEQVEDGQKILTVDYTNVGRVF